MATPKIQITIVLAVLLAGGVAIYLLRGGVRAHERASVEPELTDATTPARPTPIARPGDAVQVRTAIAALASARPVPAAAPMLALPDPHVLKGPPGSGPTVNIYRELEMTPVEQERTDAAFAALRKKAKALFRQSAEDKADPTATRTASRQLEHDTDEELKAILGPERTERLKKLQSGEEPMTERSVRAWDAGAK